jgi:SHS2 domain-containing protein
MEKFIIETRSVPVDFDPFAGPEIESTVPSTEAQREVFVASEMGSSANIAYNESVTLILEGTLDRTALERALEQLLQRHESLRSVMSASGTHMIVLREVPCAMGFHDLTGSEDNGWKRSVRRTWKHLSICWRVHCSVQR